MTATKVRSSSSAPWKSATVKKIHSDETFTVQLLASGQMLRKVKRSHVRLDVRCGCMFQIFSLYALRPTIIVLNKETQDLVLICDINLMK